MPYLTVRSDRAVRHTNRIPNVPAPVSTVSTPETMSLEVLCQVESQRKNKYPAECSRRPSEPLQRWIRMINIRATSSKLSLSYSTFRNCWYRTKTFLTNTHCIPEMACSDNSPLIQRSACGRSWVTSQGPRTPTPPELQDGNHRFWWMVLCKTPLYF